MPTSIRSRAIRGFSVALLVSAVAACGAPDTQQAPPPSASPVAQPKESARETAPPCREDPPPANVVKETGSTLVATVAKQSGPSSQWNIALPQATASAVPELAREELPPDFDATFRRAYLEGGAFTYGGMVLQLHLAKSAAEPVVINDIRPVNMRSVCLPSGLLVLYGSEGGDFVSMVVDLDAARPIAHRRSEEDGNVSTDPFFATETISLDDPDGVDVFLDLRVAKRAYTFEIAVSYVEGGENKTQVIGQEGRPFRAMPSICPDPGARATLSKQDEDRLRGHRFDRIVKRDGDVDANGNYLVKATDTSAYLDECQTW